jgi:UDP-N-acetylmuramoyl-tripeptide--D-alanyl-D-alanine ligase
MQLTLRELADACGGVVVGNDDVTVDGFGNDSRSIRPGECFVAIVDARDGHDYVDDAFTRGAVAALVERVPDAGPCVVVDDPVAALAAIAGWVRSTRLARTRVVGITGSTGKTSTKDLLVGALGAARRVHSNPASFNNEIGLPITILGAAEAIDVLVCEMGARFAGNIADLCAIARPEVGVVTNIGVAHAEHLGGRRGVERVKGELLEALSANGVAVLGDDDPASGRLVTRTQARVLRVGERTTADVRFVVHDLDAELRALVAIDSPWGPLRARLGLRGAHQVLNAALAATVALDDGVSPDQVAAGLTAATGSSWRMDLAHTVDGITVLNDAYNANPQSMRAALVALRDLDVSGRRVAVLGAMRELGSASRAEHEAIGQLAATCGVQRLVAVGAADDEDVAALAGVAAACGVDVVVTDRDRATGALTDLRAGDAVLIKASRAVGLEAVAAELLAPGREVVTR